MSSNKQRTVDDLLQCPICMFSFHSSGSRVPKMLSCQHSFCIACLKGIARGNRIQCPVCRREFETSVEALQNSLVLLQLMECRRSPVEDELYRENPEDIDTLDMLSRSYEDTSRAKLALEMIRNELETTRQYDRERLELVVQCAEHHKTEENLDILQIAIPCLYLLLLHGSYRVPQELAEKAAAVTIASLDTNHNSREFWKNGLSVLSFGDIIQSMNLNHFQGSRIALKSLETDTDFKTENTALKILTWWPRRISREENGAFGTRANAKILVSILEKKVSTKCFDDSLSNLIGALLSLTDETPSMNYSIVHENVLPHLSKLLEEEQVGNAQKSSALTLLHNIAEVPSLRLDLIQCQSLTETLHSILQESKSMRASYSAGGVIAHMLMVAKAEWKKFAEAPALRKTLLRQLHDSTLSWESAEEIDIGFLSFKSFYPLLQQNDAPSIQLFAAWSIQRFCLKNEKFYHQMLIRENGTDVLRKLKENPNADKHARRLAKETLGSIY